MSDESNGTSLLDDIIFMAMIMYALYIVLLAIPIIPYFDAILKVIFSVYTPDSFLGKIFTWITLFIIGFLMLEAAKAIGEKVFYNRSAMFLFLYGQGLILIGLMGNSHTYWYISSTISILISEGFNEPLEKGILYLTVPGIIAIIISFILNSEARPRQRTKRFDDKKVTTKSGVYQNNNIFMKKKLETIQNANKILSEGNPTDFEKVIIQKAKEYRSYFTVEELNNIPEAIKKYS